MKDFPKTRQELLKEFGLPDNEETNKAISELINEGLIERSEHGYCLTNPRGVKAAKKVIKDKERKKG